MGDLELIVCGAEQKTRPSSSLSGVPAIQPAISAVSAADCNQHLRNTASQFFALAERTEPALDEPLQQSIQKLQADPALIGILLIPSVHRESLLAWQNYPARLAALRENPAQHLGGIVFRTSPLKELGFADVSDPVWDVVIRASHVPQSLGVLPLGDDFPMPENAEWPELAPSFPDRSRSWLKSHLDAVSPEDLVPRVTSPPDGVALKAGLLQIHDYLHASHELSQSVQGRGQNSAGDYWHAIMHRREPDYSNAKYWFRNVGSHPIFNRLAEAVDSLLSQTDNNAAQTARQKLLAKDDWDPFAFVDFCQECNRDHDPELTQIAKHIQWQEMLLLLDQTYRDAST